ncbi:uncharacterized protein BHQ10_005214 [Talaromyces amestolkiae]|uniref:Ketoreductase domain-containing protein n=1 Tax=Talaromyces amestolkiae TaxID=1196081 RepID=A0A364L068_TALAM|nr:uncharacterized protein BHQ10_005214 [Talaromyces amestolkiae]RAO69202.1 hypothetical protein BHQ10_005214 [Talaromyces amestolkiae]
MLISRSVTSILFLALGLSSLVTANKPEDKTKTCIVKTGGNAAVDDAPAIYDAFHECGQNGRVVFSNTTYYINSVMNTSHLHNCEIDIYGTLLWGTNLTYWLNNSLPVGYQNQSTAWVLGGTDIKVDGHGYGTLNGNGDSWYAAYGGVSNKAGRPLALTIANTTNLDFRGVQFIRSQMWSMAIIRTHNAVFDSIYVNNTSTAGKRYGNSDGANTIYSSHITFNNWTVDNGDDSISLKANSTDISITNSNFYHGLGIAIGSIGQYKGAFETIQRAHAKNNYFYKTTHAAYFKTWTGEQVGYPPNGGGGGLGFASDLVFENMTLNSLSNTPFTISQCTTFSGTAGNCSSSEFQIKDIVWASTTGTTSSVDVASFQCSAVKPCTNLTIEDVSLTTVSTGDVTRKLGIVTGGSRGIGEAVVRRLAAKGCNILIVYTSNSSKDLTNKISSELSTTHKVHISSVQADLTDPAGATPKIVDAAKELYKSYTSGSDKELQVDILINNAGVGSNQFLNDATKGPIDAAEYNRVYNVNVLAPLLLTQALAPFLPTDRSGRIVNVSSVSSSIGYEGQSVYAGTKAALEAMTRCWSRELYGKATVNAVNPGPAWGDMYAQAGEKFWKINQPYVDAAPLAAYDGEEDMLKAAGDDAERFDKTVREGMGGRRPGFTSEIAGTIVMLCTEESGWTTGSVVCANGGMKMSIA